MSRAIPAWIFTSRNGKDVVEIADAEYPLDPSKPPVFFLPKYLEARLPAAWIEAQEQIPLTERHPLADWLKECRRFLAIIEDRGPLGEYKDILTSTAAAVLLLAYDMYSLDRNRSLQDSLIERLIVRQQFQGARHEISVAATMMRVGFDLEFEDESDSTRKHPEFIATHRATKTRIAVEAKSIHRKGIMGFDAGKPPPTVKTANAHKIAAQVCGQVKRALLKANDLPFYVFIDLNLPPDVALAVAPSLFDEFNTILPQVDDGIDRNGLIVGKAMNLLTVTNRPIPRGETEQSWRDTLNLFLNPDVSECRFPDGSRHIEDVKAAINDYGTVPGDEVG